MWNVGALCRAIADTLHARFSSVAVRGEVSGFSRASSGHCYFSIKDSDGQLRCAMFRRSAALLDFSPKDGELVEVRGRVTVYEARGDLQFVVDSMQRAGQGALFEQFMRLKSKLESEGLFDAARKRPLPVQPRAIGVVTSLGAAALHDVVTALRRRVPHIPVVISPAQVQGIQAPVSMVQALQRLYRYTTDPAHGKDIKGVAPLDVILLVRGGGSMEDLWSFNDESLARCVAQSPVPIVSGVGHETDFTIADFCADLRAPTPTAAAELVAQPQSLWMEGLRAAQDRLEDAVLRQLDLRAQRVDMAAQRLGRPSGMIAGHQMQLQGIAQRLRHGMQFQVQDMLHRHANRQVALAPTVERASVRAGEQLDRLALRLELLDPRLVLQRGYALLEAADGRLIASSRAAHPGDAVRATLVDGVLDLTVTQPRLL